MRPWRRAKAILICLSLGCSSTNVPATGDLAQDLEHVDPRIRVQAMKATVEANRVDLLDRLVKALSDRDGAVRMAADIALRKLTGQDFDYKPHGTLEEREDAIVRWTKWVEVRKADGMGARGAVAPAVSAAGDASAGAKEGK